MIKQVLILSMLLLCACTGISNLRDNKGIDIEKINIGSSQSEVEKIAGLRVKTMLLNDGYRIDYYRYSKKLEANLSKAILHSALTYVSAGSWEFFGMQLEKKARKEDQLIAIVYDNNNRVAEMSQHEQMHDYEL